MVEARRVGLRGHKVQNPRKAMAKREGIMLAAAKVISSKGYAAATLDDIAQEVKATKGSIYYYFRSKEEIFVELRATSTGDGIARVEAIIARGTPPDVTLREAVRDLIGAVFGPLEQYAVMLEETKAISKESLDRIRNLERHYEGLITGIIQSGIRQGVFVEGEPKLMAFTVLRACNGVADWYSPEGTWSPEFILEQVSNQVMAGVLKCHARSSDDGRPVGLSY